MPQDPQESRDYLLKALSCDAELKVDYHKLAGIADMKSANLAQKKFKAIVEASGEYKLVNGGVTNAADAAAATTDNGGGSGSTPRAAAPATPKTPRKRKVADSDAYEATGQKKKTAKVATPRSKGKAKASAANIKAVNKQVDNDLDKHEDDVGMKAEDEEKDLKEEGEIGSDFRESEVEEAQQA